MMCYRLHCILQYALYNEICRMVFELDSMNISIKLWQPEILLSSFIMGHFVCLSRSGQNDDCQFTVILGKGELNWRRDFKYHLVAAEILQQCNGISYCCYWNSGSKLRINECVMKSLTNDVFAECSAVSKLLNLSRLHALQMSYMTQRNIRCDLTKRNRDLSTEHSDLIQ